jgi:hypothetical protein
MTDIDDGGGWANNFMRLVPGIVTVMFCATYCGVFAVGVVTGNSQVEAQGFSAVVAGVVGYWFAQKGQETAAKQATLAAATNTAAVVNTVAPKP